MKQIVRSVIPLLILLFTHLSLKAQVDGLMYSMTYGGGTNVNPPPGVINKFDPLTNYDTAVVNFTGPNGFEGYGNFIQLSNGLLYGMTASGGPNQLGNLIQYNIQTGKESVLYNLPSNLDSGAFLYGSLCHATNDLLYGLAYYYGGAGRGELFSFNYHTGAFNALVGLNIAATGGLPTGSLIQVTDSLLYGFTTYDSRGYYGTIFKYNIYTGDTTRVYSFRGGLTDGSYPRGNLLLASNGLLYGLTQDSGAGVKGVLFSFNTNTNTETVLVNFSGPNGATPEESLMQASDGNLYGTTKLGGIHDSGILFSYNIGTNTETVLYNFGGSDSNGYYPYSDVIQASDGLLYGNTNGNPASGGRNNWGTIFSYNIGTHTLKTLHYYNDTNGAFPYGDLLEVMTANVAVTNNPCPNDSSGVLTVNVRGGKAPFTYSWSNGASTQSISSLKSGVYSDTVWDSRGIVFISTDTIKPSPMILGFNVSNACNGQATDSVSASVSGGTGPFSYMWSTGQTTDTISNLALGTYTCTVTDAHNCLVRNTVVITQAAALNIVGFTVTQATYPTFTNGSITASVSGGIPPGDSTYYYYLWSNGGSTTDSLKNLTSGSYSLCVTSPYGCGSICDSGVIVTMGVENLAANRPVVDVYPVPSSGLITVTLTGGDFENIKITDALGRLVYTNLLSSLPKDNTLHIDLSAQPNGVYILYVNSQQGVLTRKIIIQK